MRGHFLLGAAAFLACIVANAQSVSSFWGGAYLQTQECGLAVAAMGGAGVALPGEIGAALLNPAVLGAAATRNSWSLALDATYEDAFFRQDARIAHKTYIANTGRLVQEAVVGSTNSNSSLYLGYNALSYASTHWSIALIANRSIDYRCSFRKGRTSILWWRPVWSTAWGSSPEAGMGNVHENQYALVAAYRPVPSLSLGIGVSYTNPSVNISSTVYDPDFPTEVMAKESSRSSSSRFVPLVGILWSRNHWSVGLSYEGGFSVPMTIEQVAVRYTRLDGEYQHAPRGSIGAAYTAENFQASIQLDRVWSELHTNQLSSWYPASWFRTDNGYACRAGMKFSEVWGIKGFTIMVGVARTRNSGLYLKPGTFSTVPPNAPPYYSAFVGYYLALTYPKHEPLTTVSCGAQIKVNEHITVVPEVQASRYSKAARLGVVVNF